MKTFHVQFKDGPLDGKTRLVSVPNHWKYLRWEHRLSGEVHIYYGSVSGKPRMLNYLGIDDDVDNDIAMAFDTDGPWMIS